MNAIWTFLSSLFFKLLIPFGAYIAGRQSEQKSQTEQALEAMRDAKDIHNRVDTDPSYRERVRDRFK
jgi:hypothetical protein